MSAPTVPAPIDLRPDTTTTATARTVYVPDTPGVEWFVFAVPADAALLDDPGITARQVALDVAAVARQTAEQVAYNAVLERRHG